MPKLKARRGAGVMEFEAIGTAWRISFEHSDTSSVVDEIHALIDTFDQRYSRFRSDSFVRSIADAPGHYIVPDDAEPLLNFYKHLYDATDGRVTPLIGNLMSDAGYDAEYSLWPRPLRDVPEWNVALSYHHPLLQIHQPVLLDFGAAGKGHLVDLVAALLRARGIDHYVINAGGDIYASHSERIALEHPEHADEAIGIATVANQAICGSAGNRRAWDRYTHIIDPIAKQSPRHLAATWVVADTAMEADGLATALFFASPDALLNTFQFEYAAVTNDGEIYASPGFPATFFTKKETV